MIRSHRTLANTIAAILIPLAVAACGGAPTPAPATVPAAATTEIPAVVATEAPAAVATEAPAATAELAQEEPTAAAPEAPSPTAEPASEAPTEAVEVAPANTKLNLNTLNGDDLLTAIPGFSTRMVREFLEYRPYVSIRQFR